MADKKVSKKVVDDKPAAKKEVVEEAFEFVTVSGETYKKYEDGRLIHAGN